METKETLSTTATYLLPYKPKYKTVLLIPKPFNQRFKFCPIRGMIFYYQPFVLWTTAR
jgi:hypothetical protein